ncbi:MAG: hypothetical protein IKE91_05415 [Clostridia bacterium]|nr:hypothetical protein [Clostridia bacterium]
MPMKLLFTNLEKFKLKPGDEIHVVDGDPGAGNHGIVEIVRKSDNHFPSGIYSCADGELLLSKEQYDEIKVIRDSWTNRSGNYYYRIEKDGLIGACSSDGFLIFEPEKKDITEFYKSVLIVKEPNGKYAAYVENGELLLEAKYDKMKSEKAFIIASTKEGEVSILSFDKVLVQDVKCSRISKNWRFVFLQKEDSVVLCSVRGYLGEFKGIGRVRQGECMEITVDNQKSIVNCISGKVIIPIGEYRSIKKQGDKYFAERFDGDIVTGVISLDV